MPLKKRLGEILVESGLITQQQLMEALRDQQVFGGRLGTILLEKCMINERDYLRLLSQILNIPAVELSDITISESAMKLVPMEVAWQYMVLPVQILKEPKRVSLQLAMADPTDLNAIKEIQAITKYRIEPALALESIIRFVLMDYYQNRYGHGEYKLQARVIPQCSEKDNARTQITDVKEKDHALPSFLVQKSDPNGYAAPKLSLNAEDKDELRRELFEDMMLERYAKIQLEINALIRLFSKKGLINPKEFMELLREMRATEILK